MKVLKLEFFYNDCERFAVQRWKCDVDKKNAQLRRLVNPRLQRWGTTTYYMLHFYTRITENYLGICWTHLSLGCWYNGNNVQSRN